MVRGYNRLIHEKSPYLLQHARNPVDWFPWGPEAFAQAKADDKPIFLSIGYSTCHWCHVMAHESFEDATVATMMNDTFVSIKVDREERPDIDQVYMSVCQAITGSGGWPLTIIMNPDKVPFFAATYLPKESRFGHTGLIDLIPRIRQLWLTDRASIKETGDQVAAALHKVTVPDAGEELDQSILSDARNDLADRFDPQHGGFGKHPKFPTPHNLMFLLRFWKRTGDTDTLHMVEKTLNAMRAGGIYDHVGFGFHRYSTDEKWLIPHFEKMLYDQALCATAYTEAALATGKSEYRRTAEEIITYVLRDMTSSAGGFYSGEDADSEGIEGKFFLWTEEEFRRILDPEMADLMTRVFGVSPDGNLGAETDNSASGTSVLNIEKPLHEFATELGTKEEELKQRVESARNLLYAARESRIHPAKDDKVLTDWNGLMIAALARAAQAFDKPEYAYAATAAADFILTELRAPSGGLLHRYRDGHAGLQANLDDYAFLIWGLIDLYEATVEVRWLQEAVNLHSVLVKHFWDDTAGAFFFTPDDGEQLIIRQKTIYDGAVPSGNSVELYNMLRLARITGDSQLENKAAELEKAFSGRIRRAPSMYTQFMIGLDFALGPTYEIVLTGELQSEGIRRMLQEIRYRFLPNKVTLFRPTGESPITAIAPFTINQSPVNGKATAYVCLNYACRKPATDTESLSQMLDNPAISQG